MDKTISIWGGNKGKLLAALLVLAVVLGAVAISLAYAVHGDVLLTKDEVVVDSSVDNGDNSVSLKFRLEKSGFYLADVKTEKDGDMLVVKFYGAVNTDGKYSTDSAGFYKIKLRFDGDIKKIVQEDSDGEQYTLVTLNHKS